MNMVSCVHWWVFEPPSGNPTVHGKCKKCGAERDNRVWMEEYDKLRTTVIDRDMMKERYG